MGTEHPDTERMHQLFDDALDDADLTGDVVPGVLTGYEQKVRARRYQAAGLALAVLAAAGTAVGVLPRGGQAAPASASQDTDYCTHQHWVFTPSQDVTVENKLAASPAADQKNCDALRTALRSAFPGAQLVPKYTPDLTLDTRLDQALVKEVEDEIHYHDPVKGTADQVKYFGSELKYLAAHPEDPANVFHPDSYVLITAAGREQIGVHSMTNGGGPPDLLDEPGTFVSAIASPDCEKVPATLKNTVRCTTVGVVGGWHGALWQGPDPSSVTSLLKGVLTGEHGRTIGFSAGGADDALTGSQMAAFLGSSAFQKYADSYLAYIDNLPKS